MSNFPRLTRLLRSGDPVRICLFGSSTCEGVGASAPENGLCPVVERTLQPFMPSGVTVINRGIGGNGATEMHERLPQVIEDRADLVVWQGGTNDVWQDLPVSAFIDQTRADLEVLRGYGCDLGMIGPQWSQMMEEHPRFPAFRDAVEALAIELGLPFFNRYTRMKSWCAEYGITREELSPDGLHLGDFGYRLLGEAVARWIVDLTGAPAV
ncbi:SGNH/GDSL hydrolase family protein [Acetobacter sp. LMG 1627]|uniref:SGNH/GDSL hydrolase family protein n=2 Tax=Acetobacter conturbans TaxID=1737472 RepID=A0ABX0K2Y8_9PROT|nr:SGNH/GDSL hydrolase family protein [Acetobacter conturbans]NHN88683.1 SGNH/GDSL hydrolase family protein [Acetobacter conturbans]